MGIKIRSAKQNRKDWKDDMPPKAYRVRVEDAICAAGNPNLLARKLGITRGAVYQWRPPYRMDPYMPLRSAMKFLEDDDLRERWLKLQEDFES